jgi:hypothetical protein
MVKPLLNWKRSPWERLSITFKFTGTIPDAASGVRFIFQMAYDVKHQIV